VSEYYNPKRVRNLYDPKAKEPFRLSRSKIDLFMECPKCFYLDRKLGVGRPPGFPFALNSAVDALLKKEFDVYRAQGTCHPLMKHYGIDAVPLNHKDMDKWRDSLRGGLEFLHRETNLNITGGIDDLWVNPKGEVIVVDYKATAKDKEVTLDAPWQIGYKRQVEVYQWLLSKMGHKVSKTAYFVYANGRTDREAFDGKLEFDVKIISYEGDYSWVEKILKDIKICLDKENIPQMDPNCDYCRYNKEVDSINKKEDK